MISMISVTVSKLRTAHVAMSILVVQTPYCGHNSTDGALSLLKGQRLPQETRYLEKLDRQVNGN